MNLKKVLGTSLTILGSASLIYGAFLFINNEGDWKTLLVLSVLGLIFFSSGIKLIKEI